MLGHRLLTFSCPPPPWAGFGIMAWPGNKGTEDGDMQGPASLGHCLDFARCSSFISDPGTPQVSYPLRGRQGRKQPEKYENSVYEAREKVCELRQCQNGAFVSVLPLASGQPLCVPTWSQRDPLWLLCATQMKTKGLTLPQVSRSLQPPATQRMLSVGQGQGCF